MIMKTDLSKAVFKELHTEEKGKKKKKLGTYTAI